MSACEAGHVVFGYIKDRTNDRSLRKINRFCIANNLILTNIYYEDNKDEMLRKLRWGGKVIIHKIRDMGTDSSDRIDFYRKISGDGENIVSILEYKLLNSLSTKANDKNFLFSMFSEFLGYIDNYESSDDEQ